MYTSNLNNLILNSDSYFAYMTLARAVRRVRKRLPLAAWRIWSTLLVPIQ